MKNECITKDKYTIKYFTIKAIIKNHLEIKYLWTPINNTLLINFKFIFF